MNTHNSFQCPLFLKKQWQTINKPRWQKLSDFTEIFQKFCFNMST